MCRLHGGDLDASRKRRVHQRRGLRCCHSEASGAGQTVSAGSSVSTLNHAEDRNGARIRIHEFCEDA
jgi:hypothetical protein